VNFYPTAREVKDRLLKNALFSSSTWVITAVVNLAAVPIFIHYLGANGYGIYLLLTGLFGYFGLLDFGLSDGVIKYVAHYIELEDHELISDSINAALLVQVITGITGIILLWAFARPIVSALHVSPSLTNLSVVGLRVSAIGFLCKLLLNTFNAVLKGLQRFDVLAATGIAFSLLNTLISVGVLLAGGELLTVISVSALIVALNLGTVIVLVWRFLPVYRPTILVGRNTFASLFQFGAYTFITRLATALNSYFLQVVIALILNPEAVVYFAVPLRITTALEAGMGSLIAVIFPFVSSLKAREHMDHLRELYSKASKYVVALSTPVYLFIILFSFILLNVWLGTAFAAKGWLALSLLAGSSLLSAWTMVPANTAFGTGDAKVPAAFSSIVMAVNLLFSVLFTLKWGVTGTALAVLLSASQGPVFIWYVTTRVVQISSKSYFALVFAFHAVPSLVFTFLSLLILWLTRAQGGVGFVVALTSGTVLTMMYYLLLLRRRVVSVSLLGWSG
jgi:O-antigen/teichoic acid export membrane protein